MTISPELAAYKAVTFQIGISLGHPIINFVNEWVGAVLLTFNKYNFNSNRLKIFILFKLRFILRMWASGTISYIKGNHFPVASKCRTDNPPESNTRSLTLTDLAAPFFILGVGLSISIVAFIFEILSRCLINRILVREKSNLNTIGWTLWI